MPWKTKTYRVFTYVRKRQMTLGFCVLGSDNSLYVTSSFNIRNMMTFTLFRDHKCSQKSRDSGKKLPLTLVFCELNAFVVRTMCYTISCG